MVGWLVMFLPNITNILAIIIIHELGMPMSSNHHRGSADKLLFNTAQNVDICHDKTCAVCHD